MCGADKGLQSDNGVQTDKTSKTDGPFNPESNGYDYARAKEAGLGPNGTGENAGHWGSVAPTTPSEQKSLGLPKDSYVLLKGKDHPTWDKAVAAEEARGAKVVKAGTRYFSVKF
jgi:hypothetical protein